VSALEETALPEAPQVYLSEGTTIPDVERSQEALATITDRAEYGGAILHTDPERRSMLAVMWTGDIEGPLEVAEELLAPFGEVVRILEEDVPTFDRGRWQ
jgi:hypothetical protein